MNGAIELLSSHFRNPLEATGVDIPSLCDEMEDVVIYAREYLSIETTDYRKVWYNLFICPNSSDWPNVLLLCKLAFSLPFSNARAEQIFSSLKYIKNIKRNTLNISTLDNLIEIYVEGPILENFVLMVQLIYGYMIPQVEGLTRAQGNCTDHVTKKVTVLVQAQRNY